jgi:Zinc finger, C3HC4 type (RING finger)
VKAAIPTAACTRHIWLAPTTQAALDGATDEASIDGGATCCICFEDDIPQESMYSLDCQHEYCGDCLRQHVTVAVEDARMVPR